MAEIEDFKTFLKFLANRASREEVVHMFKELTEFIRTFKKEQTEKTDANISELNAKIDQVITDFQNTISAAKKELTSIVNRGGLDISSLIDTFKKETRSDNRTTMRYIEQGLSDLRSQIPQKYDDTALRQLIDQTRKDISTIPTLTDIPKPFDPTNITEDIKDHQEEIQRLKEEIEELKNRPQTRGGGTSALGVQQAFKYILKTVQPTGAIDGVNTTYTVPDPIFAVLSFSLNGETIAQLPNYTISGKTITFSSALPAAYSGKDFEIKYI